MYDPEAIEAMSGSEFARLIKSLPERDLRDALIFMKGFAPVGVALALNFVKGDGVAALLAQTGRAAAPEDDCVAFPAEPPAAGHVAYDADGRVSHSWPPAAPVAQVCDCGSGKVIPPGALADGYGCRDCLSDQTKEALARYDQAARTAPASVTA